MKPHLLFLLFWVVTTTLCKANDKKFGLVRVEDLKITKCPIDELASAYYIFNTGFINYELVDKNLISNDASRDNSNFERFYEHHFRIKILNLDAVDQFGNIEIPLYQEGKGEQIVDFKAAVYNLSNGKVETSKMKSGDLLTEIIDAYWIVKKLALTNLKVGSIIEVKYKIASKFFGYIPDWYFQHSIPVLKSEFDTRIPEYFDVSQSIIGTLPIKKSQSSAPKSETLTYHQKAEGDAVKESFSTYEMAYTESINVYSCENIPAFKNDRFIKSPENYLSRVTSDIKMVKVPYSLPIYLSVNWEDVITKLIEDDNYGKTITKNNHLDEFVKTHSKMMNNPDEAMIACFNHVKSVYNWDGVSSLYTSTKNLKSCYSNGKGNVAEINLTLVSLLRKFKLDSYPLVVKTIDNGVLDINSPSRKAFNYTIALVYINGKTYYLDATEKYLKPNLLPLRCLNSKGLLVREGKATWVNLPNENKFEVAINSNFELNSNLEIEGDVNYNCIDYGAYELAPKLNEVDLKKIAESLLNKNQCNNCIQTISIDTSDWSNNSIGFGFKLKTIYADKANEMIILNPHVVKMIQNNPFVKPTREYHIEFSYPSSFSFLTTFKIPEGYMLNEVPKPKLVKLEDGSALYSSQILLEGDIIWTTDIYNQDGSSYSSDNYETFKSFYQSIIDSQNELLVLRKK